jgi:hypothetical protein
MSCKVQRWPSLLPPATGAYGLKILAVRPSSNAGSSGIWRREIPRILATKTSPATTPADDPRGYAKSCCGA